MKALTVAQPWASLIVAGVKTIETRPSPPNGPMRPDGVRGLPGLAIERGERIAIHAAARRPKVPSYYGPWCVDEHPAYGLYVDEHDGLGRELTLSLGAIVGTVVVAAALPIVRLYSETPEPRDGALVNDGHGLTLHPPSLRPPPGRSSAEGDVSDQLPLGNFTPGRWGWLLTDPKPTTEQCPACGGAEAFTCTDPIIDAPDGAAGVEHQGWLYDRIGDEWVPQACPTCRSLRRCGPVPVRGRQGVWEWTP